MNPNISQTPIESGQIFGRLTVIAFEGRSKNGHFKWRCRCSCGGISDYFATNLRRGLSECCVYCRAAKTGLRATTHGKSKSKAYASWQKAKQRCTVVTASDYPLYGGRGIRMCEEWMNSFEAFYQHMGDRPKGKFSIERIDNSKNYEPGNCRWATDTEQANNKRNNTLLTLDCCTLTIHQWEKERPMVKSATVRQRLKLGWSHKDALLKPVRVSTKNSYS